MEQIPRPSQHLSKYKQLYPGAWEMFDAFRSNRGKRLPDWPPWCYCPLAASYSIVSNHLGINHLNGIALANPDRLSDIGIIGALGAWRVTKGIYRFDATILEAISKTTIKGELPTDVLKQLPEWCVYIETPGAKAYNINVYGFYGHLEWDAANQREELRLLLDMETGLMPVPLYLGSTIQAAIDGFTKEARKQWILTFPNTPPPMEKLSIAEEVSPFVSLLLYLCSEKRDLCDHKGTVRQPQYPKPKKMKSGIKMIAADSHTIWDVGYRLGTVIRKAQANIDNNSKSDREPSSHASPIGHIRVAHWHSFWTGSRDSADRKLIIKWLPPIQVNLDDPNDLIPVVRPVK